MGIRGKELKGQLKLLEDFEANPKPTTFEQALRFLETHCKTTLRVGSGYRNLRADIKEDNEHGETQKTGSEVGWFCDNNSLEVPEEEKKRIIKLARRLHAFKQRVLDGDDEGDEEE
jgi:hypothetical protein